jgi:predicted permease
MSEILSITGPIYLCILAGFLCVRLGLFGRDEMRVLGKFVFNVALPALLLNAVTQRKVAEIFNPTYLAAYGLGSLAMIVIGYGLGRRLGRRGMAESAMVALGLSCSNSGYIGYPVLLLVMPRIAGVSVALNMIIENLFCLPVLLVLADREAYAHLSWRGLAKTSGLRLARNPMVLAMLIGLAISLCGWRLPEMAGRAVGLFASASSAVSLFVVGGVLASSALHGLAGKVAPITLGKLFGHPLAVFCAILLVTRLGLPVMEPQLTVAAVLMAAMPMLGIYTIIAQRYGEEAQSAAALLLTTAAGFFTLSGLLWLLKVKGALG